MSDAREEKLSYKITLKKFCEEALERRIMITREAMSSAQDAANSEGKSSAGDKYETARAMSHLEKDMHARQLMAHTQQLSALLAINVQSIYATPVPGAFIRCEKISFFIAAGLGKQIVNNEAIIFLSAQSPMMLQLTNKRPGEEIDFNGKTAIVEIF